MSNVNELLDFLDHSHSSFHAVKNLGDILEAEGFKYLKENEAWNIEKGNKYYTKRNNSSIIAFTIGNDLSDHHFQICASHSDSPTFKIKDKAELKGKGGYVSLNVEGYGGMILSSWLDRPLSVAGRVVYEKDGNITSDLVDIDEDLLVIPNVAIHMNRNINDGFKYNNQIDMLPLFSQDGKNGGYYQKLADYLNIDSDSILGSDMYLYPRINGTILGANKEFIGSGRLDNLESAFCSLKGFVEGNNDKGINVYCCFDNEEVGSRTMQGAFGTFLYDCLYRINSSLGYSESDFHSAIAASFMLSIDNAHAVHPNHPEKTDAENCTYMNGGVVIKFNANQSYTSSGLSGALIKQLCKNNNVPYQVFANRSDERGGGTLGNISNNQVSLHTVDIGLAQLAMHSTYEVAGCKDVDHMINLCKAYFSTNVIVDDSKSIIFK